MEGSAIVEEDDLAALQRDHLGLTWQYLVDRGYPEEL
jgi:hypothetical protein